MSLVSDSRRFPLVSPARRRANDRPRERAGRGSWTACSPVIIPIRPFIRVVSSRRVLSRMSEIRPTPHPILPTMLHPFQISPGWGWWWAGGGWAPGGAIVDSLGNGSLRNPDCQAIDLYACSDWHSVIYCPIASASACAPNDSGSGTEAESL